MDINKKDKLAKSAEEDDATCGGCNRLFSDHQDIVDEIAECIECAGCDEWIHYSCSRLTRHAWIAVVKMAAQDGQDYFCTKCRAENLRQTRRRRGRINIQNVDEDENDNEVVAEKKDEIEELFQMIDD